MSRTGTDSLEAARALLAEATGCAAAEIADQASIDSFDLWDSLAHMRLILAIEAKTGAQVAPMAVVELMSLADIAGYLEGQSVQVAAES